MTSAQSIGQLILKVIDYRGRTPPKTISGVPLITAKVIKEGRIQEGRREFIAEDNYDIWMRRGLPETGDILVTTEAPLGEVARIGRVSRVALAQRVILLRADPTKIDPQFLFYYLRSPLARTRLAERSSGTTVSGIRQPELLAVEVPLLPRGQQIKSGQILAYLDDLIENNRRRVELLEQMAESIYREWFVHFRYPGHEGVAMVDSPLGPIPESWEVTQLSELVTTQYGYTESASEQPIGPRFLRGKDINKKSYIHWSSVPYCSISLEDKVKFRIEVGDIFVIRMADPGKVGMCEVQTDAVFASYLVRLRPRNDRAGAYFIFFTLRADAYQNWVTGASSGSTRQSVSAKLMTDAYIILPDRPTQEKFERCIKPIRLTIAGLVEQSASLAAIRDLLLPKLVTGQIDVSELDLGPLVEAAG